MYNVYLTVCKLPQFTLEICLIIYMYIYIIYLIIPTRSQRCNVNVSIVEEEFCVYMPKQINRQIVGVAL